jgi:hypothetical protein
MKIERTISKVAMFAVLVCAVTVMMGAAIPTPAMGASLSSEEAAMLTYMREEEKMARDVYLKMFEIWGAAIFSNIAGSEQRHMDTMKKMLDKYRLPDPVQPAIGVFTNPALQEKYDELVDSGSKSYLHGLYAGATIEEIDMVDIQHALDGTSRLDLKTAYQNLLEGSKNHLRAFVGALAGQGVTYDPQFISQEIYDAIIAF